MNEKELRKLSRTELMQMILELSRENGELKVRLEEANRALADRTIQIAQAGTMAEAALKLNGVFEAADAACKQYMDNLHRLTQQLADNACQKYIADLRSLKLEADPAHEEQA